MNSNSHNTAGSYSLIQLASNSKALIDELQQNIIHSINCLNFLKNDRIWRGKTKDQFKNQYLELQLKTNGLISQIELLKNALDTIAIELNNANNLDEQAMMDLQAQTLTSFFKTLNVYGGNLGGIFDSPFNTNIDLKITSDYGVRNLNGKRDLHYAIDLRPDDNYSQNNVEIKTISDGIVKFVGLNNGYGNQVEIETTDPTTGKKISVYYSHLAETTVKVGDNINSGTQIGIMGNTGYSTGPHLDLMIKDITTDQYIDPLPYLTDIVRAQDPWDLNHNTDYGYNEFLGSSIKQDGSVIKSNT